MPPGTGSSASWGEFGTGGGDPVTGQVRGAGADLYFCLPPRYSAQQMYELVANVGDYRLFVPWCRRSAVLSRRGHVLRAELEVGFPPLHERYLSEVSLGPRHIRVSRGVPPSWVWGSADPCGGEELGAGGTGGEGLRCTPDPETPNYSCARKAAPQQRSPCPKTAPAAPCPARKAPAWHLGMGLGPYLPLCSVLGARCLGSQQLFALPQAVSSDCRLFKHLETLWRFGPGLPGRTDSCSLDFSVSALHQGPGQTLGRGLLAPLRPSEPPSTSPPPARSPSSSARRCTPGWPGSSWTRWPSRWWPPSRAGRGSSLGRRLPPAPHSEQRAGPELGRTLPPAPLRASPYLWLFNHPGDNLLFFVSPAPVEHCRHRDQAAAGRAAAVFVVLGQ